MVVIFILNFTLYSNIILYLQTCLYGLGITLRCGGGKKYGSVSSMSVSKDLQDLVEWMTESENNKRPNIENVIEVRNYL